MSEIIELEDIACHLIDLGDVPDAAPLVRATLLPYARRPHASLVGAIRTLRVEATVAPKRPVRADAAAILRDAADSLERGEHHGAVARTLARYGLTP